MDKGYSAILATEVSERTRREVRHYMEVYKITINKKRRIRKK